MRLRSIEQLEIGDLLLCLKDNWFCKEGTKLLVYNFKYQIHLRLKPVGNGEGLYNSWSGGVFITIDEDTTKDPYIFNILKRRR